MRRIKGAAALFLMGGAAYVLLEKCWRGYSHWTMFLLGGGCFHLMGQVGLRCRRPLPLRCGICGALTTAAEFICGCIVNLKLKWNVWDYRGMPGQLLGQVCLPYALLWCVLSAAVMPVYKLLYNRLRQIS